MLVQDTCRSGADCGCAHVLLQDNFEYGDSTQLVGGYTAGYLLFSCLTALAYLGLWLRCIVLIRRQERGDPERGDPVPAAAGGPGRTGTGGIAGREYKRESLIRPLGPWLWPIALVHT